MRAGLTAAAAVAAGAAAVAARRRELPDLTGRTAVVTGAGSGIGRALALLLAERGAHVHLADRDGPAVEAVAQRIRGSGGAATARTVDVADAATVHRFAEAVLAAGPVDLLFNNAGIGHAGAVVDTPLDDWRRLLEVNVLGVVHGLHGFLPSLVAQGRPAWVVNTASVAGLVPVPGLVPYSTTKAAVVGLSKALDAELTGTGVRVLALCPGMIDTAIVRTATLRGAAVERRDRNVALYARRGTSADVVARQALQALGRGRTVIASPRSQVLPAWWVERLAPRVSRALSVALTRAFDRD